MENDEVYMKTSYKLRHFDIKGSYELLNNFNNTMYSVKVIHIRRRYIVKKALLSFLLVSTLALLVACGDEEEKGNESSEPVEVEKEDVVKPVVEDELVFAEPAEDEVCVYCNMIVYGEDHEMGMFTAQGIDEDGHAHFFDDVGCMLNYETKEELVLQKNVRDFNTKDWIAYGEATIVKSDMKTPMNYGYGFFTVKEDAEKYIEEHSAENAVLAMSSEVAEVSLERHKMKMEKMKNDDASHNHDEHGDGEEDDQH